MRTFIKALDLAPVAVGFVAAYYCYARTRRRALRFPAAIGGYFLASMVTALFIFTLLKGAGAW